MTDILIVDFVVVIFIFLRVFSAFIAAPIFGHNAIPIVIKISLSIVLSYIIFLTIDRSAFNVPVSLWSLTVYGAKEIITGLTMGFMLHFVFYGISYAGTLIGFDMGLVMAEMFNPMEETSNNVIGEAIYFASVIILFLINGHHYIIRGLVSSFDLIPLGKFTITNATLELLINYSAGVFVIAVKIASPILVSFFLIHIAEGITARAIPQMQIFFVTQPLKLGLGFVLLASITPIYIYVIKNLLKGYEDSLYNLIKAMSN
ncbi:MAG: flagellar biosynthetic protein FliR [Ignavibacteria bacterium CG2_30_36_16]|nr:flagellar biosynthetic protein FliR [Ignavibacteria bacterium]OIP61140.1 MAG: flagellar biosynthetic protein FliR [Ignavibacteria bacterium CG2_30_36_16]PJB01690.1 MAG: flagellar biosynthetic protein FliR [Ignavibacteria bacterium CG_4_9_14_3_um_filter_36_18]